MASASRRHDQCRWFEVLSEIGGLKSPYLAAKRVPTAVQGWARRAPSDFEAHSLLGKLDQ